MSTDRPRLVLMGDSISRYGHHFTINHQTGEVHCNGHLVDNVTYGFNPTEDDYLRWIKSWSEANG